MHSTLFQIPHIFKDEINISILLLTAMGKSHVQISEEVFKSVTNINHRIAAMNDALGIEAEEGCKRTEARLIAEAFRLKIID